MEVGKRYPIRVNINRREIDISKHRPGHDANNDFNLEIRVICDSTARSFATITIPAGGLMAALGNRAEIRAVMEFEDSHKWLGMVKETKEQWIRDQPKKEYDDDPKLPSRLVDEGWMYSSGYNKKTEMRDGKKWHLCQLYRYVNEEFEEE